MSIVKSKEIHLVSRPNGEPLAENFLVKEVEIKEVIENEVLVKNLWMSVDPYMRGRMIDRKSYVPPFELGKALEGGAIGIVIKSKCSDFKEGDFVNSNFGWREYFTAEGKYLKKVNPDIGPLQAYLGTLGMPGMTAYVGLLRIGNLKEGDKVMISAAAGAVGTVASQIAVAKGCEVFGTAGSDEKCSFLEKDLGLTKAINYKTCGHLIKSFHSACPDGVDVYFENVGGSHLEAALSIMRPNGRIALCGMIEQYNDTAPRPGPNNLMAAIAKSLKIEGFIVSNHSDLSEKFLTDMKSWIDSGKMQWKETIDEGIESAPNAFLKLFKGQNFGKMLVKIADR
jgi:NADPH-dependent curcumin reductase CurA